MELLNLYLVSLALCAMSYVLSMVYALATGDRKYVKISRVALCIICAGGCIMLIAYFCIFKLHITG